jgi:hypothetical protein
VDALSWRSKYRPPNGGSAEQLIQPLLQEKHFEKKKLLNRNQEEVIIAPTKLPYKG